MWRDLINAFKKDNLYIQALHQAHQMLDMDLEMFEASVESLRRSDSEEIDIDIYAMDKAINQDEREVRKKVMTHLTLSKGADLQSGLILVSVVIDIERIGDYTKNIYDLARLHPPRLLAGKLEDKLKEVEEGVSKDFKDMIGAFKQSDEELARSLMTSYKQGLANQCQNITNAIVSGEADDLSPRDAAAVALYSRYLKRIAAHSRNIITSVVNPFHRLGYKEKRTDF